MKRRMVDGARKGTLREYVIAAEKRAFAAGRECDSDSGKLVWADYRSWRAAVDFRLSLG